MYRILLLLMLVVPSLTFAHGGRTNSSGCHNCRTGSCAGTYHCHNGGSSSPTPTYQAPKTCSYYECKFGNSCYSKPTNAYCTVNDSNNARKCNEGYSEKSGTCIKNELKVKETEIVKTNNLVETNKKIPGCNDNQCELNSKCYEKPLNSSCSVDNKFNAWNCDDGFIEQGGKCIKDPASAKIVEPEPVNIVAKEQNPIVKNDDDESGGWGTLIGMMAIGGVVYIKKKWL